ncbi:MAG: site-specific DNA-methyltransferase [Pseudoflavonifractor sp.]|nr:site-specific DNA-methyltransferase [Pseudoflavonifractor sp.]
MAQKINKLELTWIGKDENPTSLEPRILLDSPEHSYGEVETGTLPNGKPWPGNMLIYGDNLLALRALEQNFTGAVKCIYIDPPYNVDATNEYYDDLVEHSVWLSLMRPRLQLLRNLLAQDGVIFIQISDEEQAYLKVLCDEVFGRKNFVNMVSVNMKNIAGASGGGEDKRLKKNCEYILIYAKDYENLQSFKNVYEYVDMYNEYLNYKAQKKNWHYSSIIVDKGEKIYVGSTKDGDGNEIKVYRRPNAVVKSIKQIMESDGISEKEVFYRYINEIFEAKDAQSSIRSRIISFRNNNNIEDDVLSIEYVPKTGKNRGKLYEQFYKGDKCRLFAWLRDIGEMKNGVLYKKILQGTYWDMTPNINNLTKEGGVEFPQGKKPEKLVAQIISMTTSEGDLVLDSFLGSGTTAATAHKLGRRWIGVELGDHAFSHCVPRLKKVIQGKDIGGITSDVNWKGGGGFKFYELAPSLLNHDKHGNLVINKEYNADMLAAAMAKQEGYTYEPDTEVYWKQGSGSEKDSIFTTTQFLTAEALQQLHEQIGEDESLLICCTSFQSECCNRYPNITIKKIPQMLLGRCEFDKDDYSLNIVSLPQIEDEEVEEVFDEPEENTTPETNTQPNLFD